MMQPNLYTYPNRPGYKEGTTSKAAAEAIAPTAQILRECVFAVLERVPLTADEAAGLLSQSVLSVRPRVAELFKQGRIYPTGETRKNASGRSAKVWAVKEEQ